MSFLYVYQVFLQSCWEIFTAVRSFYLGNFCHLIEENSGVYNYRYNIALNSCLGKLLHKFLRYFKL